MTTRPSFIDIRSHSRATNASLPSPRFHMAGEVTPALSPLDAFAAQSRLLAKQLSESESDEGKRMSRLPPLAVETVIQPRMDYFRAVGHDEQALRSPADSPSGIAAPAKPAVETPVNRPVSVHPRLSSISPQVERFDIRDEERRGRQLVPKRSREGYFGARRDQSPVSMDQDVQFRLRPNAPTSARPSTESLRRAAPGARRPEALTIGYKGSAPPRSPFTGPPLSSRSLMSVESSDDDANALHGANLFSPYRPRAGSVLSTATNSPATIPSSLPRSPSVCSDASNSGMRLQRPSFNFSRPISRQSTVGSSVGTSAEGPSRQASSDSQPSLVLSENLSHTSLSFYGDDFSESRDGASEDKAPAASYVYSRFNLPRGKALQRNSLVFQEPPAEITRNASNSSGGTQIGDGALPSSPRSRPSTASVRSDSSRYESSVDRPSFEKSPAAVDESLIDTPRPSAALTDHISSTSISSASTIKPKPHTSAADHPADEHVSKAIEFHESGALTKSTYHLRLAARQAHPTGMLLYALACRHGWGMKPNQREGVAWLRKAMDSAGLEIADDENQVKDGKTVDILQSKTRKAQFALAIYELGVSHLNGWGIEQDKALALRCFEIAGSWGDGDALAEAGFCYAQGVGCKKDLKKSARYYRQAEAKGISMVGHSWIYKSKYNDDNDMPAAKTSVPATSATLRQPDVDKEKDKKQRSKSRSRSMFSRKRPDIPNLPI